MEPIAGIHKGSPAQKRQKRIVILEENRDLKNIRSVHLIRHQNLNSEKKSPPKRPAKISKRNVNVVPVCTPCTVTSKHSGDSGCFKKN
jgi:hypothetical protein